MERRFFLSSGATAVGLGCVSHSIFGDESNWQGWRGPNRDGLLAGATWPGSLDEKSLRSVWSKDFGDSYWILKPARWTGVMRWLLFAG